MLHLLTSVTILKTLGASIVQSVLDDVFPTKTHLLLISWFSCAQIEQAITYTC